jgi:hypothetical protein
MNPSAITLNTVWELASQLSLEERSQLVARIGAELNLALAETASGGASPGSAQAILHAMRAPPHLSAEDVDELEQMIALGKLPVRQKGVFDTGEIQ